MSAAYPFQMMVLHLPITSENNLTLCGPMSRPYHHTPINIREKNRKHYYYDNANMPNVNITYTAHNRKASNAPGPILQTITITTINNSNVLFTIQFTRVT